PHRPPHVTPFPSTTLFRSLARRVYPGAGTLAVDGKVPGLAIGVNVQGEAGALAVTGQQATVSAGALLEAGAGALTVTGYAPTIEDRKSTRLNSSHVKISYA